jgi:hypothetical protein
MELLGDVGPMEPYFSPFGDIVSAGAIYVQDRCPVCTKRTIGLEIILDALDGTPRWRGTSGSSF